jgi:hypothetical protein
MNRNGMSVWGHSCLGVAVTLLCTGIAFLRQQDITAGVSIFAVGVLVAALAVMFLNK